MIQAKRLLPLALLYYSEGKEIEGRTRFQKLAFLADQKLEEEGIDPFEFYAYNYGPFDEGLYDSLDWLKRNDLVTSTKKPTYGGDVRHDYQLTNKGEESVHNNVPLHKNTDDLSGDEEKMRIIFDTAEEVVKEYSDLPISNLIKTVYDEYPEYAKNSVLN